VRREIPEYNNKTQTLIIEIPKRKETIKVVKTTTEELDDTRRLRKHIGQIEKKPSIEITIEKNSEQQTVTTVVSPYDSERIIGTVRWKNEAKIKIPEQRIKVMVSSPNEIQVTIPKSIALTILSESQTETLFYNVPMPKMKVVGKAEQAGWQCNNSVAEAKTRNSKFIYIILYS
jgi:hypothetical protein